MPTRQSWKPWRGLGAPRKNRTAETPIAPGHRSTDRKISNREVHASQDLDPGATQLIRSAQPLTRTKGSIPVSHVAPPCALPPRGRPTFLPPGVVVLGRGTIAQTPQHRTPRGPAKRRTRGLVAVARGLRRRQSRLMNQASMRLVRDHNVVKESVGRPEQRAQHRIWSGRRPAHRTMNRAMVSIRDTLANAIEVLRITERRVTV